MSSQKNHWVGVGYHPTPDSLAGTFAQDVIDFWNKNTNSNDRARTIRIVDLFAGDGRLGIGVARELKSSGIHTKTTLVEFDKRVLVIDNIPAGRHEAIHTDAYSWNNTRSYDIVVSNPPYLSLNRNLAAKLGFDWGTVQEYGYNLYGLGIGRALNACKPGGIIGIIAPFGWLVGSKGALLRNRVQQDCARVQVKASRTRDVFPSVHQDIATILLQKRTTTEAPAAEIEFSYDTPGEPSTKWKPLRRDTDGILSRCTIKVGPVVWNRRLAALCENGRTKSTLPLIYGGNIGPDGRLHLPHARYSGRQFADATKLATHECSMGPSILIRRTLRGRPGSWKVDSCIIADHMRFAAENHVLVVRPPAEVASREYENLRQLLSIRIQETHYASGTPHIGAKTLRSILKTL